MDTVLHDDRGTHVCHVDLAQFDIGICAGNLFKLGIQPQTRRTAIAIEIYHRNLPGHYGLPYIYPLATIRDHAHRWIPNPISSAGFTFAARLRQGKPVFVHGDGESLWTLTATSDFAVGLAGLVGNTNAIGETYHITSDEALTWNRIYAETAAALGVDSPTVIKVSMKTLAAIDPELATVLKGDKVAEGVFDNAKIKQAVLEFTCRKSFCQGIREAVAWFDIDALFDQIVQAVG